MNFIFQSGEFYNNNTGFIDLFVNFVGILLGAGVAIFVFERGLKMEKRKEEGRLDQLTIYLGQATKSLCVTIEKQIEQMEQFKDSLGTNFVSVSLISDLHPKNIRWITYNELYTIYVLRRHNGDKETFSKLNRSLDFLDSFELQLNELIKKYEETSKEILRDYNSTYSKIREIMDQMAFELNNSPSPPYLNISVLEARQKFAETIGTERSPLAGELREGLLTPLLKICVDFSSRDGRAGTLLSLTLTCIQSINGMNEYHSYLRKSIGQRIDSLNNVKERFSDISNITHESLKRQGPK